MNELDNTMLLFIGSENYSGKNKPCLPFTLRMCPWWNLVDTPDLISLSAYRRMLIGKRLVRTVACGRGETRYVEPP